MDVSEAASENPFRRSCCVCPGEQDYVDRRKQIVLESLNNLGINCSADSVPHIALLASGGGQRAAVGLVGSLSQLEKEGLLDTLLYLGGVSGSTWSMSSLYGDPEWSKNLDRAEAMLSGPGVDPDQVRSWLEERAKEEFFSLTDIWAVLTSAGIMKRMEVRLLSDEAKRNATNPYPIYSAIEKHCYSNGPIEGKWFEVSPHESGFTELGLFVGTSQLGSRFQSGQLLEQKPEMDMIKLQGILGSALAHEEVIRDFLPLWMQNERGLVDGGAEEYLRVYTTLMKMAVMAKYTIRDPTMVSDLNKLQQLLKDKLNRNESALLESKSPEERKAVFHQWRQELEILVKSWIQSLEDGAFKTNGSVLLNQVLPLFMKWDWGTTSNFLFQYKDFDVPPCLHTRDRFQLVDAGLLINVGYPPFLGEKRDIDLIIAPEYSAGNMFETLTLARDYAAKVKKPFPEIDAKILEEREWPRDCYVFQGKEKEPTIVYMPLFNRRNCKDAEEFAAQMEEYATFQRPFSEEKIHFVLETVKANIKNNRETLLREINRAVLRRQSRGGGSGSS